MRTQTSTKNSPQRRKGRRDYAEKRKTLRPLCALCVSAVSFVSNSPFSKIMKSRLLILSGTILLACLPITAQTAFDVKAFDRERVLKAAKQYLSEPPVTITASTSPRSAGGPH